MYKEKKQFFLGDLCWKSNRARLLWLDLLLDIQRTGSRLNFIHNHSHYDLNIQTQDQKDPYFTGPKGSL